MAERIAVTIENDIAQVMLSRPDKLNALDSDHQASLDFHAASRTAYFRHQPQVQKATNKIAIVSAGTSDAPEAEVSGGGVVMGFMASVPAASAALLEANSLFE